MEADIAAKIKDLLSDPESLANISSAAASLSGTSGEKQTIPQDRRVVLLEALKPFIREEKRERVDAMISALAAASVLKAIKK